MSGVLTFRAKQGAARAIEMLVIERKRDFRCAARSGRERKPAARDSSRAETSTRWCKQKCRCSRYRCSLAASWIKAQGPL
jgi:hypothetical protein